MIEKIKEALRILKYQFKNSDIFETIIIYGANEFISKTKRSLQLLKDKDQKAYLLAKKAIRHIAESNLDDCMLSIRYFSQFCKVSERINMHSDEIYAALLTRVAYQIDVYINNCQKIDLAKKPHPWSTEDTVNSANFFAYSVLKNLGANDDLLKEFKENTDLVVV